MVTKNNNTICKDCLHYMVCSKRDMFQRAIAAVESCVVGTEDGNGCFVKDLECIDNIVFVCKYFRGGGVTRE